MICDVEVGRYSHQAFCKTHGRYEVDCVRAERDRYKAALENIRRLGDVYEIGAVAKSALESKDLRP
jgi:hypothetical protein